MRRFVGLASITTFIMVSISLSGQTSEQSWSAGVVTQLHETVQNQTNLLEQARKTIPQLRDVIAPKDWPNSKTLARRYEKELNDLQTVIKKLTRTGAGPVKNWNGKEMVQLLEKSLNYTKVLERVSKIFANVRQFLTQAGPPTEESAMGRCVQQIDEIKEATEKFSNESKDTSAQGLIQRMERVNNQTILLQRVKKVIPEVHEILVPANPPLKDTLIYGYVKKLNETEVGIRRLISLAARKNSSVDDTISRLEKRHNQTTKLLKRFRLLVPNLREVMVPANPPLKDTMLYRYDRELKNIAASARRLLKI